MKYDFTLYGSDTDTGTNYPLKTDVEAHTGVETYSPDVLGASYSIELESEGFKYLDGTLDSDTGVRSKWTLRIKAKQFPQDVAAHTDATDLSAYFPLDLFDKKYHYLYFGEKYPLQPNYMVGEVSNRCLAVAIKSVSIEDYEGLKSMTIELWSKSSGIY